MGQALIACAKNDPALTVAATVDVGDDLAARLTSVDAVIEFAHPDATPETAAACATNGKTLVIGTTGHSEIQRSAIQAASEQIPIVFAPNFSVGVNALFWLTRKAALILGASFDLEVVEMHHRLKKDAPSGTARRLAEILAESRALSYAKVVAHGRVGMVGERPKDEIGMHALRGGDVVGDHTVVFSDVGERLELSHKASSRETFASGALRAAKWAHGRHPALYSMEDVLGLNEA
jgi:4-hydroxy-tetrahydrodipicolinate reductase